MRTIYLNNGTTHTRRRDCFGQHFAHHICLSVHAFWAILSSRFLAALVDDANELLQELVAEQDEDTLVGTSVGAIAPELNGPRSTTPSEVGSDGEVEDPMTVGYHNSDASDGDTGDTESVDPVLVCACVVTHGIASMKRNMYSGYLTPELFVNVHMHGCSPAGTSDEGAGRR